MDLKEQKKEIRREIRTRKGLLSAEERISLSQAIGEKVLAMEEVSKAGTILLYASLPDEVDTEFLLRRLSSRREGGKKILLPVVEGDNLILKEYVPGNMEKGYCNIEEPQGNECASPSEVDLAIVPGVAFDAECNRLGRGKGFYDRLIPNLKCRMIGLGFNFQIVPSIPCEEFDRPLDVVVTECTVYQSPL